MTRLPFSGDSYGSTESCLADRLTSAVHLEGDFPGANLLVIWQCFPSGWLLSGTQLERLTQIDIGKRSFKIVRSGIFSSVSAIISMLIGEERVFVLASRAMNSV